MEVTYQNRLSFQPLCIVCQLTCQPVWLACTLSFILGLPSLGSSVAFAAATSIATIGLYISYGTSCIVHTTKCNLMLSDRNSYCTARHIQRSIRSRSLSSRKVLLSSRCDCRHLDLLHLHRFYSAFRECEGSFLSHCAT